MYGSSTLDVDCVFKPRPSHSETPIRAPVDQTIDFTECTSLTCGVLRWCELICIISHLKRDVLEGGGAGVYKVAIVQSQDRENAL